MAKFTAEQVPLIAESTPAAVEAWLRALHKINMLWHMDDDPADIENFKGIVTILRQQQNKAWTICMDLKEGIWGLPVWKELLDQINEENDKE